MADLVTCGCCKGKGRVPLTGVYKRTLMVLRRQMYEVSGAELARIMGCNNEAMCNRLVRLQAAGFAKSRREGRERLWAAQPWKLEAQG